MLFIFLLALIVLGPRKLPEVARQLGRIMGDIRRASNDFQSQIEDEVRKLDYEEAQKKTIDAEPAKEAAAPSGPQILPSPDAVKRGSGANDEDKPASAQEQSA